MWYRGVVGKGRQKVLPEKRIIFGGELVTHLYADFYLPAIAPKGTSTDRWENPSRATASKCTYLGRTLPYWVQHCHQSVRVCETVVSTKLQQWSFTRKAIAVQRQSNSRLLVDSTSIRLANRDCCRESSPLFKALRHRTPSSPICLSEVVRQALRLIARIPLIQRREKCPSREGKSTFP